MRRLTTYLVLIAVLSACSPAPRLEPLRVAFNTWPGYEFIYLAKTLGYFEEAGVPVKLVELSSLSDVRRAFERGQADIMASTIVEVLIAAENSSRELRVIAVSDASNGGDMLLARKPISSVSELRQQRIGMEGATVDVLVVAAALDSAGLTFDDVQVISKAQDDLVADIEAGNLDAIQTYPPYATKLLETGRYTRVFDTAQIPGIVLDTITVDAEVLTRRPEAIARFLAAYFRAQRYYDQNREIAAAIMGAREGLTTAQFIQAASGMDIFGEEDQEAYLRPGGKATIALEHANQALTRAGWIHTPFEPASVLPGEMIRAASAP